MLTRPRQPGTVWVLEFTPYCRDWSRIRSTVVATFLTEAEATARATEAYWVHDAHMVENLHRISRNTEPYSANAMTSPGAARTL
eukprot:4577410-Pleurochrysis_carterae.AAC.2